MLIIDEMASKDPKMICLTFDNENMDDRYITFPILVRQEILNYMTYNDEYIAVSKILVTDDTENEKEPYSLIYLNSLETELKDTNRLLEKIITGFEIDDFFSTNVDDIAWTGIKNEIKNDKNKNVTRYLSDLYLYIIRKLYKSMTDEDYEDNYHSEIFSLDRYGITINLPGENYELVGITLKYNCFDQVNHYKSDKIFKIILSHIINLNYALVFKFLELNLQKILIDERYTIGRRFAIIYENYHKSYTKNVLIERLFKEIQDYSPSITCLLITAYYKYKKNVLNNYDAIIDHKYDMKGRLEKFDADENLELRFDQYIITPQTFCDSTMIGIDNTLKFINGCFVDPSLKEKGNNINYEVMLEANIYDILYNLSKYFHNNILFNTCCSISSIGLHPLKGLQFLSFHMNYIVEDIYHNPNSIFPSEFLDMYLEFPKINKNEGEFEKCEYIDDWLDFKVMDYIDGKQLELSKMIYSRIFEKLTIPEYFNKYSQNFSLSDKAKSIINNFKNTYVTGVPYNPKIDIENYKKQYKEEHKFDIEEFVNNIIESYGR